LKEERYIAAAARCADFLLVEHRTPDGGLYRTSRDGVKKYAGFLDDYAYLALAITELATATGDARWTAEAERLMDQVELRFGDDAHRATVHSNGYFFSDRNADDLIVRQKTASDSPLPSGNAAAAMALLALGRTDVASATIATFAPAILEQGEAMSAMVQAAMLRVQKAGPFTIAPAETRAPAESLADQAKDAVALTAQWDSPLRLIVRFAIAEGWHVNAHDPGAAGLVGTEIKINPPDLAASIGYPAGDTLHAAFATEPVRVYSGALEVPVEFAAAVPAGTSLRVTVRYQLCSDTSCVPPVQQSIDVSRSA
jgi:hypothetical protein